MELTGIVGIGAALIAPAIIYITKQIFSTKDQIRSLEQAIYSINLLKGDVLKLEMKIDGAKQIDPKKIEEHRRRLIDLLNSIDKEKKYSKEIEEHNPSKNSVTVRLSPIELKMSMPTMEMK